METREFEVRLEPEARTVRGIAVPYGQTIELNGFKERFEPGAIKSVENVKLYWQHKEPIGKVVLGRETDEGYEIEAQISTTERGNEAYTLLKDGVIDKFSVGFIPVKTDREGDTLVRRDVELREVSLVSFPAYSGAGVSEVREDANTNNKEKEMTEVNDFSSEVAELRDSVAELGRKFDKQDQGTDTVGVQYRSAGEWIKALAQNESNARDIATRDFGSTVEADVVRPAWINSQLKLVEKQRIVQGLFGRSVLPKTGNSIEYPFVRTETGTVAKQTAEGADLAYMELALDTATAPVHTYGGYASLSRQAIERSDLAYLESVLRFQTIQYGNATELAVQNALVATSATANTVTLTTTLAAATADGLIGAVIDAKAAIDDNSKGLEADFILVSRDVHRSLSVMKDTAGRPIFTVNGDGSNTWGNIPAGRLAGVLDGTPVVVGKNLPVGTVAVASAQALISYESSGAPFRLADENIINLTKDFSLYGYMAIATPDVKGITFIVGKP